MEKDLLTSRKRQNKLPKKQIGDPPMNESNFVGTTLPLSRVKELVVQETNDEILVYDLKIDKAHHLNETTAMIWKHCDGKTSSETVRNALSEKLKTKIEDDFIWVALKQLDDANLLEEGLDNENYQKLSRRKVLQKYALPTLAIPVVMSLVTPVSAQMGSCVPEEGICTAPMDCCAGLTCNAFEGGTCDLVPD